MLRAGLLAAALVGLLACATTVRSRPLAGMGELEQAVARIAVAPFRPTGRLARQAEVPGADGSAAAHATHLVSRYLTEALHERGPEVIPADDVARALGVGNPVETRLAPIEVAERAAEEFGADAVLIGEVSRFVERRGRAAGATRPASVGFLVTLYLAPGGEPVWEGAFEETQQALGENIFNAVRYPGAGLRWLSAEDLARWGATEVAGALPLEP